MEHPWSVSWPASDIAKSSSSSSSALAAANLSAKDALEDRSLSADGDGTLVPILTWARDLTRAADGQVSLVVADDDWSGISLPRSWKRGQTIAAALENARLYSRRFRVIFTDEAVTLAPRSADDDSPDLYACKRESIFRTGDLALTFGVHFNHYWHDFGNIDGTTYILYEDIRGVGGADFQFYGELFIDDRISVGFMYRMYSLRASLKDGTSSYSSIEKSLTLHDLMLFANYNIEPLPWFHLGAGLGAGILLTSGSDAGYFNRSVESAGTYMVAGNDLNGLAIGFRLSLAINLYRDLILTFDWLDTMYLSPLEIGGFENSLGIGLTFRIELYKGRDPS